ncbi:MAG: hypothetical protein Q8O98_01480, partial [bacterium]|nr:hypothetical protein [bacterium]
MADETNTAPTEETQATEAKVEEIKAEAPASADVEVPAKFKKIVEEIEGMSVLDLNELVKMFESKFGVSATAVAATAGPVAAAEEESSTASVELTAAGE